MSWPDVRDTGELTRSGNRHNDATVHLRRSASSFPADRAWPVQLDHLNSLLQRQPFIDTYASALRRGHEANFLAGVQRLPLPESAVAAELEWARSIGLRNDVTAFFDPRPTASAALSVRTWFSRVRTGFTWPSLRSGPGSSTGQAGGSCDLPHAVRRRMSPRNVRASPKRMSIRASVQVARNIPHWSSHDVEPHTRPACHSPRRRRS